MGLRSLRRVYAGIVSGHRRQPARVQGGLKSLLLRVYVGVQGVAQQRCLQGTVRLSAAVHDASCVRAWLGKRYMLECSL